MPSAVPNIITKQPTNDFSGFAQIGAGSGQEREGIFALSGPIVPNKLLFRVSGEYKDADGQIENSYLNEKVDFYTSKDVRAKLLWLASDNFTVDWRYAHTDNTGGATYDVAIPNTDSDPTNVQNIDPHADILGNSQLRSDDATIKADWKLSPGTWTWPSSWGKADRAIEYSHANPPKAVTWMAMSNKANIHHGRRRRRGGEAGMVMVAMIND
jgi:iron complex outermembrane receptor protein